MLLQIQLTRLHLQVLALTLFLFGHCRRFRSRYRRQAKAVKGNLPAVGTNGTVGEHPRSLMPMCPAQTGSYGTKAVIPSHPQTVGLPRACTAFEPKATKGGATGLHEVTLHDRRFPMGLQVVEHIAESRSQNLYFCGLTSLTHSVALGIHLSVVTVAAIECGPLCLPES